MASPFQRYQGEQVQAIPAGYLEAMGQGAMAINRGLASFGEDISAGIQKYAKNKMEGEAADAKLSGAIQHFTQMSDAYKGHPEFDAVSGIYAKAAADASAALTGSLGKKLGALSTLEVLDKQAGNYIAASTARNQALAAAAYGEQAQSKKVEADIVLGRFGYKVGDGSGSLIRALQALRSKASEFGDDPNRAQSDLIAEYKAKVDEALTQEPENQMLLRAKDELDGAATAVLGQEGARASATAGKITKGVMQQIEGFGRMAQAQKDMTDAGTAEALLEAKLAKMTPEERSEYEASKAVAESEAQEKQDANLAAAKKVMPLADGLRDLRTMLDPKNKNNVDAETVKSEFNRIRGALLEASGAIQPLPKGENDFRPDQPIDRAYTSKFRRLFRPGESMYGPQSLFYEQTDIIDALEDKLFNPYTGYVGDQKGGVARDKMYLEVNKAIKELEKQYNINLQEVPRKAVGPEQPGTPATITTGRTIEKDETAEAPIISVVGKGRTQIEAPISAADRAKAAQAALANSDYVKSRFGGRVPPSMMAYLQQQVAANQPPKTYTDPSSGAQFVQTEEGKWQQIDFGKTAAAAGAKTAAMTYENKPLFSQTDFDPKNPQPQYVVNGKFNGDSQKDANDLFNRTQKRARALTLVNRLNEINETSAESLRPTLIGEAQAIVNELAGMNRIDIVGPGQVAVAEWELMFRVLADPTKFWELDDNTKAKLKRLSIRIESNMHDEAYANGLSVRKVGSGKEMGRQARRDALGNR